MHVKADHQNYIKIKVIPCIKQTLRYMVASVPYPSIEFRHKSPLKYFA